MEFAGNDRISHRQLYRQMILALLAPFLLCLFQREEAFGTDGIMGTVAAVVILLFYVTFLVRVAPGYASILKSGGKILGRICGLFFLSYLICTAAFLLAVLQEVVPESLIIGVPGAVISFLALLVCSLGTHRGMQRRGRMAEVSGKWFLGVVLLMMALSVGQGKPSYLREMFQRTGLTWEGSARSCCWILCCFSGISFLPFVLGSVEKRRKARKPAALAVLTLGGILVGMELLLPAVLGWDRVLSEKYPVFPLLAGANLPGDVLARFDVLWMAFLLYGLLFSLGSLLHYGHQVVKSAGLGTEKVWMDVLIFVLSLVRVNGYGVEDYYFDFLGSFFVPGMAIVQIYLAVQGKRKKYAKGAAALVVMAFCLLAGGCSGIEPEKRMYPMAMGIDRTQDGYLVEYAMPDMAQTTGQDKQGEGDQAETLRVQGSDFEEIERIYRQSQDRQLDLGHLEVLILGDTLLSGEYWTDALAYLKEKPFVGEDVYVFRTGNVSDILEWKSPQGQTAGEFLRGILENRGSQEEDSRRTLGELYYEWYRSKNLPAIPSVICRDRENNLPENGQTEEKTGLFILTERDTIQ